MCEVTLVENILIPQMVLMYEVTLVENILIPQMY